LAELGRPPPADVHSPRGWVDRWAATDLPKGSAGAAVTVVLRSGSQDVEGLLIERTVREDDLASGHVALPGGHVDPDDLSLRATALRELSEEVGLGAADLDPSVRCVGVQRASLFGLDVAVFTGVLASRPGPRVASPEEVAHIFWLPRPALTEPTPVERSTRYGPRTVPAVVYQGHVLWGFTLRVLREYFGLEPATAG
jgi:8-oxo-dGTP pyrophosphatase MutT (NUDIX family)